MCFNDDFSLIGNNEKEPVSITVEHCNEKNCEVSRDSPSRMEFTFKTEKEAKVLTGKVSAYMGVWVPYPNLGDASKVCNNLLEGECPVAANTEATYVLQMTAPKSTPIGMSVRVEVRVTDQNKKVLACVRFPIVVVA